MINKTFKKKNKVNHKNLKITKNGAGLPSVSQVINNIKDAFQYLLEIEEVKFLDDSIKFQESRLERKNKIKILRKKLIDVENQLKNFVYIDPELPFGQRIYKGTIDLIKKYPKTSVILSALTPLMIYKISQNLLRSKMSKIKDKNKLSSFKRYYKIFKKS